MLFKKKHWQKTHAFYRKNAYGVFTEKALAKNMLFTVKTHFLEKSVSKKHTLFKF